MTKVYAISMIKNEADIIECFVRYHLNIFDGIVLLDNGSTDNTLAIIGKLISEQLPLYLLHDTSLEYNQNEKMTWLMYHTFQQYEPDIVVPLDADEFLISTNDNDHPREVLDTIDLNKWYYMRTRQYVPHDNDNPAELFVPKRIQHCYGDVNLYKVIVPKEVAFNHSPELTMGNHSLSFPSGGSAPVEDFEPLRLAHYAFRSIEQAKSKIIVGWLNNIARPYRNNEDSFHWGYWFNMFKQKRDIHYGMINDLMRDLYGESPTYTHPINLSFCQHLELKYTKPNEVSLLKNLLEYGEKLAKEYSSLKRGK